MVGRIWCIQDIIGGNAPLTSSYENWKYAFYTFSFNSFLLYSVSFQGSTRLLDLCLTPCISISGKEEMKGIGVGQRPERVEGIIINLHDQTLLYMQ